MGDNSKLQCKGLVKKVSCALNIMDDEGGRETERVEYRNCDISMKID